MVQGIGAGHDAAGAVAEQKNGQPRLPRFGEPDERGDIRDVICDVLDIETIAVGLSSTA